MKIETKVVLDPAKEIGSYPCIKIAESGRVVLFTSPQTGFQLHGEGYIGTHSKDWVESGFEPLRGSVTLSNG